MAGNHSDLEKRLWDAADELRANSKLKSSEYSVPVLGLIFLRFADNKFAGVEQLIRQKLIEARLVDVMVVVGSNFFYTVTLPCTLWFLDRAKTTDSNPTRQRGSDTATPSLTLRVTKDAAEPHPNRDHVCSTTTGWPTAKTIPLPKSDARPNAGFAKQFFTDAAEHNYVVKNPFDALKGVSIHGDPEKFYFITEL